MTGIQKVCPTESELCSQESGTNVPCPIIGCGKIVPRKTNLWMHMAKVHRVVQPQTGPKSSISIRTGGNVSVHYHCPKEGCIYNPISQRHFSSLKNLKQHYMTVHAEKRFKCPTCSTGFGLEGALRRHAATCGQIFKCGVCKCPYSTREGLLTHCRRMQHPVPEHYRKASSTRPALPTLQTVCLQPAVAADAAVAGAASATVAACSPKGPADVQPEGARRGMGCSTDLDRLSSRQNLYAKTEVSPLMRSQPPGVAAVDTYVVMGGQPELKLTPASKPATHGFSSHAESTASTEEPESFTLADTCSASQASEQKTMPATILPKPNVLLVTLNPQMQPSQILYVADARLHQMAPKAAIAVAPKPSTSPTTSSVPSGESFKSYSPDLRSCTKTRQIQTDPVQAQRHKRPTFKMTMSTQTSLPHKRTVAQTQTTGDFILKQAMRSARIPSSKESKGSQVSPRAKVKRPYVQSSHTQTAGNQRPMRKRRRKSQQEENPSVSVMTPSYHPPFPAAALPETAGSSPGLLNLPVRQGAISQVSPSTFTSLQGHAPFSNSETQTLLEELEATLAESISTQTLESYLANSGEEQLLDCGSRRQHSGVQTHCSLIGNQTDQSQTADQSVLCSLDFVEPKTPPTSAGLLSGGLSPIPYGAVTSMASSGTMLTVSDGDQSTISKSQQTVEFSLDALEDGDVLSAETQTCSSDLDISSLLNTSSSQSQTIDLISHMHMETQTGGDEDTLQDFFSNMHTQTSEEYLTNFSFSDIETQTSLNAMETQTLSVGIIEPEMAALGMMNDIPGDQNPPTGMSADVMHAQASVKVGHLSENIQNGFSSSHIETQTSLTTFSSGLPMDVATASATVETQTSVQGLPVAPSTDTETQTLFPGLDLGPDLTDSHTQTSLQDLMSFVKNLE